MKELFIKKTHDLTFSILFLKLHCYPSISKSSMTTLFSSYIYNFFIAPIIFMWLFKQIRIGDIIDVVTRGKHLKDLVCLLNPGSLLIFNFRCLTTTLLACRMRIFLKWMFWSKWLGKQIVKFLRSRKYY